MDLLSGPCKELSSIIGHLDEYSALLGLTVFRRDFTLRNKRAGLFILSVSLVFLFMVCYFIRQENLADEYIAFCVSSCTWTLQVREILIY